MFIVRQDNATKFFNPLLCLFSQPWIIEDVQKMLATKTTVVYTSVISSSQISLGIKGINSCPVWGKTPKKKIIEVRWEASKKGLVVC